MNLSQSCASVIRWAALALLVLAPVAFGGDHVVPITCIELAVLGLLVLWAIGSASEGEFRVLKTPLNLPLVAFVALVAVQLVLSHPVAVAKWRGREAVAGAVLGQDYIENKRDSTAALNALAQSLGATEEAGETDAATPRSLWRGWRERLRKAPLLGSVYYMGTLAYFCRLITCVGVFFLVTHAFRTERDLGRLVGVLIAVGMGEALYGLVQYLTGANMILWMKKRFFLDAVTGTYVNRNHFAGLMELVVPIAFASAFLERARARRRSSAPLVGRGGVAGKVAALTRQTSNRVVLLYFVAIVMTLALVFSRSRGGLAAFLFSLILLALLLARRRAHRGVVAVIAGIMVLVLVVGLWVGMQSVVDRFYDTLHGPPGAAPSSRVLLWKDSLSIFANYPALGSGLGTYQYVFPRYQTTGQHLFFDHVHNDYLEVLTDTGLIGFGLVVWCAVGLFRFLSAPRRQGFTRGREASPSEPRAPYYYLVGGSTALAAILIHSFTDFNLHIPANALIVATITGVIGVSWKLRRPASPPSWVIPLPTLTARIGLLLVACLFAVAMGGTILSMYKDTRQAQRLTALAEATATESPWPDAFRAGRVGSHDAELWYAGARYAMARYRRLQGRPEDVIVRAELLKEAQRRAEVAAWLNPVVSRYYLLAGWARYLRGTLELTRPEPEGSAAEERGFEDEFFRRAILFDPHDPDMLYSVGTYLLARGQDEQAMALYARANALTRVDSPDSQLETTLHTLFSRTQSYSHLQSIIPAAEPAAHALFADFLLGKGLFEEGVRERELAAALLVRQGDESFSQGGYERAAGAYASARRLDRGNARSLISLARSQARLGRGARALDTLGELLAGAEDDEEVLSQALTILEEMAAVQSYGGKVYLFMGVFLERLGQWGRAAEALRRALALDPNYSKHPGLHASLGRALRKLGLLDMAAEEMHLATSLDREDGSLWRELAAVYREKGADEAAREADATFLGTLTSTIRREQWPSEGVLVAGAALKVRINAATGPVRFSLQARGAMASEPPPYLLVRLNNRAIWCGAVDAGEWSTYEFAAQTLAGTYPLSVELLTDYNGQWHDRKVFLGDMHVSQGPA